MRRWLTAVNPDVLGAVLGLTLLTVGVAAWSVPAACIVAGTLLFLVSIWPTGRR